MNLTAVRDPEEIVARHFGESFFAARHLFSGPAIEEEVADLGSGAGFPGLPLKIWKDSIRLTLIEANQRKAAFLREAARELKLDHVAIENQRAENVSATYDLVTLRAVESFQEILPVAQKLVRKDGRLALLIGQGQVDIASASLPDLAWNEPIAIPGSTNRCLLIAQVN
jgi:16S rRNA (guanine527-N7)-methyltransferase